jgi:predicted protein tyrosine phosphatase
MKYRTVEQIEHEADVHPTSGMSRRERLERWAEALERQPKRRLSAIQGTEFGTLREREAKRADNSPLTVAFEDPVLRAAGLRGDAVGDAVDFFDLSHREMHRLVCYCHQGLAVSPGAIAMRIRAIAQRTEASIWAPHRIALGGVSAAAAVGLVLLAL